MPPRKLWRRLALAVFAVSLGLAPSIRDYVFAEAPKSPPAKLQLAPGADAAERGRKHYQKGEYPLAVKAYNEAIGVDPLNPSHYFGRGSAYAMMGNVDRARADFNRQIELESQAKGQAKTLSEPSVVRFTRAMRQDQPVIPGQTPAPPTTEQPVIPQTQPTAMDTSAGRLASLASSLPSQQTAASGSGTSQAISNENNVTAPNTTGDLLRNARSVSVRRTSAVNLDPRVRGYHSSQLNASADGASQIKTRVDIDSLFANVDPGLVRRIEVVDGPYTSLYGPGFAFLIADLYPTYRSECGFDVKGSTVFDATTNGRGLYIRENLMGGGEYWGFYASSGRRSGNDYQTGDNSFEFRIPASYEQWDGYFGVGVDMTARSRVEMSYLRTEKNNVELPGVIYDINQSKDEQFNVRYILQDERDKPEQALLQYWWTRTPYNGDSRRQSKIDTFYNAFLTNQFFGFAPPNDIFNLGPTISRGVAQTTGVRGLLRFGDVDDALLTVGADWRRQTQFYTENHLDGTGVPSTILFGQNAPFGIPRSSMEDYGLFTELAIPSSDEFLTLKTGGRLDWTKAWVGSFGDNEVSRGGTLAGTNRPFEFLGMAFVSTKLRLVEAEQFESFLNSGVAYAMRQANLAELYSDSPFVPLVRQGNSVITGNSNLLPENNLQFDLGLTASWGDKEEWGEQRRFSTGARAFHSTISNYILYKFDGVVSRQPTSVFSSRSYTYDNLDRATLWGGDVFGQYFVTKWLALNGTLAYVKGTNHSPESIDPATGARVVKNSEGLPGIYPLQSTVGVLVTDAERQRWGIEFSTRMVNGQNFVADSLFEAPTPGFTVCDVRGYWTVRQADDDGGATLRLTGGVENLFDRTYTEHGSLAIVNPAGGFSFVKEPGLNLRVGLELEY